jgi:hypothetical protein
MDTVSVNQFRNNLKTFVEFQTYTFAEALDLFKDEISSDIVYTKEELEHKNDTDFDMPG